MGQFKRYTKFGKEKGLLPKMTALANSKDAYKYETSKRKTRQKTGRLWVIGGVICFIGMVVESAILISVGAVLGLIFILVDGVKIF